MPADPRTPDPSASDDASEELVRAPSPVHEFPCETCAANMTWDPAVDALACAYCGARQPVPRADGEIEERPLDAVASAARGLGIEARVAKCQNCGAGVTYGGKGTSEVCVYCGSSNVLSQDANRNALRPESVVPLDVGEEEVRASFQAWIAGLWLRPNALAKTKRFEAVGVYVPFWTFDCHVDSSWSADAGYYYWVTETYTVVVNGKTEVRTRSVRKVRWVPAWGERSDDYDDVLILASKGLPGELVDELGGFDTKALVPYRPEYLAGWRAEEYEVELESGWDQGRERVRDSQRARCSGDVPGDTQRDLRVHDTFTDVRWKHVLLPIWSLQYRFQNEVYTVLINGQTGKIVGKAPYSWVKIGALVLAVVAVVVAVVLATS